MSDKDFYIRTAADLKKCIGQTIFWDDVSRNHVFLRSGVVERVIGLNVVVDGDYKMWRHLSFLRTFEMGGEWQKSCALITPAED